MLDETEERVRKERQRAMEAWRVEMIWRKTAFHEEVEVIRRQALRELRKETMDRLLQHPSMDSVNSEAYKHTRH